MLDIGGSELLVIALVLILVVGPKDLPRVLRSVGRFMSKMRGMTREFQRSMDDMAREADIADMRKELNSVSDTVSGSISDSDITKKVEDTLDTTGTLRDAAKEDFGSTGDSTGDSTGEATDEAAAQLPPLAPRRDTETPETETASSEAALGDDADAGAAASPAPAPADPEEKRAQAGGAAEA